MPLAILLPTSSFLFNQSISFFGTTMINQYFYMINQNMIRHAENFWGSGSYSKTVRPIGFFIYRRS